MKSRESLETTLKTYIQVNWKNLDGMDEFLDTYNQPKIEQRKH
jgi:hypothetical protein